MKIIETRRVSRVDVKTDPFTISPNVELKVNDVLLS
jgi:hypothetical protein